MNKFSMGALLLGCVLLGDCGIAQTQVVVTRSISRSAGVGDGDIGAVLSGTLSGTSRTATFPGMTFSPTQLEARATASATNRLFGASRQAVYADAQVSYRDGTYLYSIPSGALVGFRPGMTASAGAMLRIAGQTVFLFNQGASLTFNRSASYPLFTVGSPTFDLGPVSVGANCSVIANGQFWGGLTVRPRLSLQLPSIVLAGHAHGWITGSARAVADLGIASASANAVLELGNTHVDADATFTPTARSGRLFFCIDAVRLYIRLCASIPFWSSCRTIWDRTYGRFAQAWTF